MTQDPAAPLKPRRALLSVSDKRDLVDLGRALAAAGVALISTGGTARALRDAGLEVGDVSDVTGAPEMLDGRVKTLHPAVHGGLLARRDSAAHLDAIAERGVDPIDLLVVNLYPFEETVAAGADFDACVEQIDIGGPAMIRSAAKNHAGVIVVTDPSQYAALMTDLAGDGVSADTRRAMAMAAYQKTAAYDAAIAAWFAAQSGEPHPERLTATARRDAVLRYGENPHQSAAFYKTAPTEPSVASAAQLHGKALSYNNMADADAAFELAADLDRFDAPAVVVVKHANPCGVALADGVAAAYESARRADPVSAFGGVVASNREIDADAARAIAKVFTEVVVAPGFSAEARDILAAKKDIRLLAAGGLPDMTAPNRRIATIRGGYLVQDSDVGRVGETDLKIVTDRAPTYGELRDLLFAWVVAKHVKSNAIVYAKDRATVGVGAGQMSRVDSTRIAARKALEMAEEGAPSAAMGSVVASDAFFPFADGLLTAAEAGATAVIQPGGSIRDEEVIAAANQAGLAMVFTGMRHFRH